MGFSAALPHAVSLQLSSSFHGELSLISLKSTPFLGLPFSSAATSEASLHSRCHSSPAKRLVVWSKRFLGLEEAMRISRERELLKTRKVRTLPPLRRGRVSPPLPVPDHIPKPPYVGSAALPEISSEHQVHDEEGISRMRAAGELAARVLEYAGTLFRPSVTTNEIDKAVHQMIIDASAYPSPGISQECLYICKRVHVPWNTRFSGSCRMET